MSTKPPIASRDELIRNPDMQRPHVVILGAGASVASCPGGDKNGRRLPTMENLIEIVGLDHLLTKSRIKYANENFEALYSSLYSDPSQSGLIQKIESAVHGYFSSLELPDHPTVYDHLLLSLRKKDAVFTFNWDPFLYDAWVRNHQRFRLPEIFFLHGNVRAAYCPSHPHRWGAPGLHCPECSERLVATNLLYPIKDKNYTAQFINSQWENACRFLANAFTVTIFGYGVPASDVKAVDIMKSAWHRVSQRLIERVEIIDIKNQTELYQTWQPFITHHHADYHACFCHSRAADYPRRSCEALYAPTAQGRPAEKFPIPIHMGFDELYEWLNPIAQYEGDPVQ